jgi:hypothetical protein
MILGITNDNTTTAPPTSYPARALSFWTVPHISQHSFLPNAFISLTYPEHENMIQEEVDACFPWGGGSCGAKRKKEEERSFKDGSMCKFHHAICLVEAEHDTNTPPYFEGAFHEYPTYCI